MTWAKPQPSPRIRPEDRQPWQWGKVVVSLVEIDQTVNGSLRQVDAAQAKMAAHADAVIFRCLTKLD